MLNIPLELDGSQKVSPGRFEWLLDLGLDAKLAAPHGAAREKLEVKEETTELDLGIDKEFGVGQDVDDLPAFVRGRPLADYEPSCSAPWKYG